MQNLIDSTISTNTTPSLERFEIRNLRSPFALEASDENTIAETNLPSLHYLALHHLQKMMKIIENNNPSNTSLDHYFHLFSNAFKLNINDLNTYLWEITSTISGTSELFQYSIYIRTLKTILLDLQLTPNKDSKTISSPEFGTDPLELWRILIERIWVEVTSPDFSLQQSRVKYGFLSSKANIERYAGNLLKKYKRLLVLRVDFEYKKEFASQISESQARSDIKRLIVNRRWNKQLLPGLVGYVCRIEWELGTRYHFHVLFMLDGDRHQKDDYLAQFAGEYWVTVITQGKGRFYNCNRSKEKYTKSGIGMIHFSKPDESENFISKGLGYMLTMKQELVATQLGHKKSIWRGMS